MTSYCNCVITHCMGFCVVQWNLRKRTPRITETSTMWTRVRGPELYSIILQLLKKPLQ